MAASCAALCVRARACLRERRHAVGTRIVHRCAWPVRIAFVCKGADGLCTLVRTGVAEVSRATGRAFLPGCAFLRRPDPRWYENEARVSCSTGGGLAREGTGPGHVG
jgi:hypothetical protein